MSCQLQRKLTLTDCIEKQAIAKPYLHIHQIQKNISSVFARGHHLSNMFRVPQLHYLLRQAVYRIHAMIDVYIRLWRTRNTIEGRIYTPVAVDVLISVQELQCV